MAFIKFKKKYFIILTVAIGMILFAGTFNNVVQAGSFPTREIELIVCYPPGGSTDLMARIVGGKASEYLKVPVVIINKPGAGGAVASDYVARSHDGYRILTAGASNLGTILATSTKIPYTLKDFSAIARAAKVPEVIVTKKGRFDTFEDLVKEGKKRQLTFGSWGAYSSSHLVGELISMVVGIKMKHVPFKGGAKAMLATMGGHIDIAVSTPSTSGSNIKAGNLTCLAVTTDYRLNDLPDVPTLKELGYPDATFESYDGFATSSKIPKDRLEILREAFKKSLKDIGVQKALKKGGMMYGFMTGNDYDTFLEATLEKLRRVAINGGIVKD